jgi:predicted RNase H-like HicB family nuclease
VPVGAVRVQNSTTPPRLDRVYSRVEAPPFSWSDSASGRGSAASREVWLKIGNERPGAGAVTARAQAGQGVAARQVSSNTSAYGPPEARGLHVRVVDRNGARTVRYDELMDFTAAVTHEDPWYVARCLDVEVASQGETAEEALANLKEALELYFEDEVLPEGLEPPIIATLRLTA